VLNRSQRPIGSVCSTPGCDQSHDAAREDPIQPRLLLGDGAPAEYGVMGIGGSFWPLSSAITIHIQSLQR
jgi:hypothetical protein